MSHDDGRRHGHDLTPIGEVRALTEPPRATPRLVDRLDPHVFERWMGMLGDRIGRRLEKPTLREYYLALVQRFDTAQFEAAARVLFGRALYAQWPGPQEFADALEPPGDLVPGVPGIDETARYLAEQAARAREAVPPPPEFSAAWRAALNAAAIVHVPADADAADRTEDAA
jgi:hypothetical protein